MKDKRWIWISLGILSIITRFIFSEETIETYYSRGFFVYLRNGVDFLTGLSPIALVYFLFFLLLGVLVKSWIGFFRRDAKVLGKVLQFCYSTIAFFFGVVFFFMILWGYNYDRISIEKQLGLEPKPLSLEELKNALYKQTEVVVELRAQLSKNLDTAISNSFLPNNIETTMREALKSVLQDLGYPTPGNVRGRFLHPKGLLLRISTAGVYIPFTAEGHIDPGLHHLQIPYVIAHEMSHGYGFGDEGTCNFLAWLTCISSKDPFLNYVGELAYWRNLAGDYRWYRPYEYLAFFDHQLPNTIKNDLRAIYAEMEKYPDIFPRLRNAIYDSYLKAQGIDEGLENYNRILVLVKAWKEKQKLDNEN